MSTFNGSKTHCKRGHPFDEENTYRHPQGGRVCKTCLRAHRERYVAKDPERERERLQAINADVEYQRGKHLRKHYGLTLEDWQTLYDAQAGRCAICGADGPLNVDHCHDTMVIRGLLCWVCNVGIGKLGDDAERLQRAADYLRSADTGFVARRTIKRYRRPERAEEHPAQPSLWDIVP